MLEIKLDEDNTEEGIRKFGDDLRLPLQVSIGQIEVSLYDFMNLTSGFELNLTLSENSSVTLLFGGEPIATADLAMLGDQVSLKLKEVFLNQESKKNDNQKEGVESIQSPLSETIN